MDKESATKGDIDKLAEMIARGFDDAATKSDIRDLDRIIEGLEMKISSYAARWTEDFAKLHNWILKHENRLRFISSDIRYQGR